VCTNLKFFKDRLCASFANKFKVFDLKRMSEGSDVDFPSKSDSTLSWVLNSQASQLVPMAVFKIKNEFLLCYNSVGFFVNEAGKHTRSLEFKWLSTPISFGKKTFFCCYSVLDNYCLFFLLLLILLLILL
jgi:hypothetical protein